MKHSSYTKSWAFVLFLLIIASCGRSTNKQKETQKAILTNNTVDTSLITIIPFENSREWIFDKTYSPSTLTQDDIEKIETLMTDCVNKYNKRLTNKHKEDFVIDLLEEKYKRQYVAVVNKNGDKEVWINCFCQTYGDNWKTSIVMVDDGGNCYFSLKINLKKEKCYDLLVNGHA